MGSLRFAQLTPDLAERCAALERLAFPKTPASELLSRSDIEAYARTFPEGFVVCLDGDEVVGQGAGIMTDIDFDHPQHTMADLVGANQCGNHDPAGAWYYGTDIAVHPTYRRRGIGRRIYELRKQLVRRLGKRGIVAGAYLAGFADHKDRMSASEYVGEVVAGRLYDPTLSFQLRNGFQVHSLLPGYITDPATDGWAALIVWQPQGAEALVSWNPRTGRTNGAAAPTSTNDVERALAAAAGAAAEVAGRPPAVRAAWLRAIADAVESDEDAVDLADRETAKGVLLRGELKHAAAQLRFYADVAEEGSWLQATSDVLPTGVQVGRVRHALGPVAVFGASNFPFAFGGLGNDTASALAAGCPVVAKAHPAHPLLSEHLGRLAAGALARSGAPEGTFALVAGFDAGRGGSRFGDVAADLAQAFTLGMGQYCTKPGLVVAPRGTGAADAVATALSEDPAQGWLLTSGIADAFRAGLEELRAAGASLVASVPGPDGGWSVPTTVLSVDPSAVRRGSRIVEECFGPVLLVAEYDGLDQLDAVVEELQGALAASVVSGGDGDPDLAPLVRRIAQKVGRVVVDGWTPRVGLAWGQQHGGPWPATTVPSATSVGAGALDRFTRPVAYQGTPDHALPPPLQAANPWRVPRRVDRQLEVAR